MPLSSGQIIPQPDGRYRILRLLGQGGMGAVYLAEHVVLTGRFFAIKENITNSASGGQQFLNEAKVLGSLDHAHLPKVSDYFFYAGNEYLVMDYVEGQNLQETLDQHLRQHGGPLPEKPVLIWADQVLDALEYLHGQRPNPIIHRDIKPANLILTPQGKVKLVDFGLVKLFDPANPRTATAMKGMGTLEYTPMEQYAGGAGHTDARSDIYALGATLYHLLTGTPPPDVHQWFIDPTRLPPPRQLNPNLSPMVEAAILKAMALHPNQRYQTAKEMRQTLAGARLPSTQLGEAPLPPVLSTAAGRRPDWRSWGMLASLVLLIIAFLTFRPGGFLASVPTLTATIRGPSTSAPSVTPMPPRSTETPKSLAPTLTPRASPTPTTSQNMSSDAVISPSSAARVAQVAQWKLKEPLAHIYRIVWLPGSDFLAIGSGVGIHMYDVQMPKETNLLKVKGPVIAMAFSPDGYTIASASGSAESSRTVWIWNSKDGALIRALNGHVNPVMSVAFSPDGRMLASGSSDKTIRLWGVADGKCERALEGHAKAVTSVSFDKSGQMLLSGSADGTLWLWRTVDGTVIRVFSGHTDSVGAVAWSPDGKTIASASADGTVRLWLGDSDRESRRLIGSGSGVLAIAFSSDGQVLASFDGAIRLWRVSDGSVLRVLTDHEESVFGLSFSPDGRILASGDWGGTVRLWGVR